LPANYFVHYRTAGTNREFVLKQNAASLAGVLLTTEAIVTELPEPKKKAAAPMPEDYE